MSTAPHILGVATLARRAFGGEDLTTLAIALLKQLEARPDDAATRMDLATALLLIGQLEIGLFQQRQAMQVQQRFAVPAARPGGPRVLALMAPGTLMTNTPLPFLLEGSDVSLELHYVSLEHPLPPPTGDHDVLVNAICQSEDTDPILQALEPALATWPRPVLNRPAGLQWTRRELAHRQLAGIPGLSMGPTVRTTRAALAGVVAGGELKAVLPGGTFPLLIRPLDTHAGQGLRKLDDPAALAAALAAVPEGELYAASFIDYRSPDGFFRKYRVALIEGQAFAVHMGVSEHWMIHYLNAGMAEHAWKRAEEAAWMASFENDFAREHGAALAAVAERMALDYVVLDCAETAAGDLLVFELDPGAIVHAMDPTEMYPYKPAVMQQLFVAYRAMLTRRAARSPG